MADVNITKVYLLSVPLENDYLNTLYFSSASAQQSYFQGKIKKSYTDFSYQRKDEIIRVPAHIDTLYAAGVNYVMYQNTAYSSKWFYAFIKDMKYIQDDRTDITIETDCMQTWLFDYQVKASFVEREHTDVDVAGLDTVPEQLETGEYKVNSYDFNHVLAHSGLMCIAATVDLTDSDFPNIAGGTYNGTYSGVAYFIGDEQEANATLTALAEAGKSDAVTSIFSISSPALTPSTNNGGANTLGKVDTNINPYKESWATMVFNSGDTTPTKPTTLDGYTPKNKKLLTYPYCYMLASNNAGGGAIYKYEKFSGQTECDFYIYAAICPGMSIRLVPKNYNGAVENWEEGLNLGKYPICSWNTDVYTNWLTQNSVNIATSIGSSLLQIGGGIAMASTGAGALAGAGAITSGALGIASSVGQIYSQSLQPPQAEGNLNGGDVTGGASKNTFYLYHMSIKSEYARIIDDYFTMFGYKTNRVKIPNTNHRLRWWYTKCIDANIDGNIPNKDLQIIKDCYNKGITFWRSTATIQDYSQENTPVE